jgi:hypothetical protein
MRGQAWQSAIPTGNDGVTVSASRRDVLHLPDAHHAVANTKTPIITTRLAVVPQAKRFTTELPRNDESGGLVVSLERF